MTRWRAICRHRDTGPLLVLVLIPIAALGRALRPGRVLSPADILFGHWPFIGLGPSSPDNGFMSDVTYIFHPGLLYAAREISTGRFPLWNPHAFGGAPFFANPQTALLFPLTALVYVLPAAPALTLIAIGDLTIAGVGTYWLLRTLAVRPGPAIVGSLVYMLHAPFIVWLQWSYGNAISVLPLLFAAAERVRTTPTLRSSAVLALTIALELFAGYPQIAAVAVVVATLWAVSRGPGETGWRRFATLLGLGVALGVGVAMIQVLPFLEYVQQSVVLLHRRQWIPSTAPPLRSAVTFLMPGYYGTTPADFWGLTNFNETTTSVGLVPWLLVPVAALAAWRRNGTWFLLGLAVAVLAIFYRLPLVHDALTSVPPFAWMVPQRVLPFLALAVAVLTATALDSLAAASAATRARSTWVVVGGFLLLAWLGYASIADDASAFLRTTKGGSITIQYLVFVGLLALAAWLVLRAVERGPGRLEITGLVLIHLASALPLAMTYNTVTDERLLYPVTPAIRHLQTVADPQAGRVHLPNHKNLGALYGFREITGYDGITPRAIAELADPSMNLGMWSSGFLALGIPMQSPVFDLLGIRRVVLDPGSRSPGPHFAPEYDGHDARVFRNERALPRAFLVPRARSCVDETEELGLMQRGAIDFREEVLVAGCATLPSAGPRVEPWTARIVEDGPNRVVLRTETAAAAWLVLTDTWFPGWRATVDGTEGEVRRANHAFRAVWLPAGRHVIEFNYAPVSFRLGLGLTVFALAGVVLCFIVRELFPSTRAIAVAAIAAFALIGLVVGGAGLDRTQGRHAPPGAPGLRPMPVGLELIPPTPIEGEPTLLRLEQRETPGTNGRIDLYVARIYGGATFTFLTPTGAWTLEGTPLARGVALGGPSPSVDRVGPAVVDDKPLGVGDSQRRPVMASRPAEAPSRLPVEVGWIEGWQQRRWTRLMVMAVPAADARGAPHQWAYQPSISTVRTELRPPERLSPLLLMLLLPGVSAVLTSVLIVVYGVGRRRDRSVRPQGDSQ